MAKKSHTAETLVPVLTILSDIIAIEASFLISFWIRFLSPINKYFPFEGDLPLLKSYVFLSFMVIPIWLLIFQSRKMYRPRRVVFIFDEFFLIIRLVSFAIIFAFGLVFFYRVFPYSRFTFVLIWFCSIVLITFGRYVMLKIEKALYRRGKALNNAIIVGNNELSADIFKNFNKHPYAGYKILGYINDDSFSGHDYLKGMNLLGTYSVFADVVRENNIRTILVTIPSAESEMLYELLHRCEGENVEFLLVPDFLEMLTSSVRVQEIDGIPFLKIKSIPMNFWNNMLKRAFDILFSSIVLSITSPLLIIIAILVKLTSKGKVLYSQERVSLEGKKFKMIKFRSMVENAEASTGAVFASKDDNRSTPIGKFLRKYSLDELPQYFNVLIGDMSVVGPRPEREVFINLMKDKIPKYLDRHRVKCGITGWAQVNGLRGQETSLEKRIEYDIYYIENWSIVFDLKIIIRTFKEMFFSKVAF
ncbi:MAG: undecaprenyl-phosphate glucose phosphotransferase [Ignavibacteria bacterium]